MLENFPLHFFKSPVSQRVFLPSLDKDHLPGKVAFLTEEEEIELHSIFENLLQMKFPLEREKTYRLRHSTQNDLKKTFVHYDPFEIVGAIFLHAVGEISGFDLSFYRHKETGWTSVGDGKMKIKQHLLVSEDIRDLERWEIWHKEKYLPGKCVWHPGNFYHAPPICNSAGGGYTLDFFFGHR